ncbi:MAG: amidase [Bryobacterales bacterium]|nr:amidase [Bryobacterales bacterium]
MQRRHLLALLAGATACHRNAPFAVEEADITTLGDALRTGRITSRTLVESYLARIHAIDRGGPRLNSVIDINPDALAIAAALDAELAAGKDRGPLHGVPILVKDNIDTADRMKTTAGSFALVDAPTPTRDAPIVSRLREAGAVLLGKTNLSEWANIRANRSTSGWSARGGLTLNPYALNRNTSGSSSGSAAAAAASLCAAAVGTETDGSIVSPSSICGLAGIKPTIGLLNGEGIIPISRSQDTAGPMARTVRDAALLLSALRGPGQDFAKNLNPNALRGARLGVARRYMGENPHVNKVADQSLNTLRDAGAILIDPFDMTAFDFSFEVEILAYELRAGMEAYLHQRGSRHKSLDDLIAFNRANASTELVWFGQEFFEMAARKGPLTEKPYRDAVAKAADLRQQFSAAMDRERIDAIVCTTDGPAWTTDLVNGDRFGQNCSTPAAVLGLPHITVPAGQVEGLPVGFSFFGRANSDQRMIELGFAFEQATKARRPPPAQFS